MPFPFYKQPNAMDCGPCCLRMIAKYHGKNLTLSTIRQRAGFNKDGVSLFGLSAAAETLGFHTRGAQITYAQLVSAPTPSILHWCNNHFVVLVHASSRSVRIADPAVGIIRYSRKEFLPQWITGALDEERERGTILLIEPADNFSSEDRDSSGKLSVVNLWRYLLVNKWRLSQVFLWLFIAGLLQLLFPYLAQTMVDVGIGARDVPLLVIILIAQLTLTLSLMVAGFIRSRLQLKISSIVNMTIRSELLHKLTRLPLTHFESIHTGDTLQRIADSRSIQNFLTGPAITGIFSLVTYLVYSISLLVYSIPLFTIFTAGSALYFVWIKLFMRTRRKINYETFKTNSQESANSIQFVHGMQEIRLHNAQQSKRWEWENIQARIIRLNFRNFEYSQWQSFGALFLNQGKDILITFMVAKLVVDGQMTIGSMIAIQYIIGQLSVPVNEIVSLAQTWQDAKISMERLNEIHSLEDEEPINENFLTELPPNLTIRLVGATFGYPGQEQFAVLNNIHLTIPEGKTTAIVGPSGSGKTTILKLLLRIHDGYTGNIFISDTNIRNISPTFWRNECGSVLQDGFIFNDTIAENIAITGERIDFQRLIKSCEIAGILSFIKELPKGFNTRLGAEGIGISQGQKQRLFIARAVYKDPKYLFFDEATNSLDSTTEKEISENLQVFFKNRTVVIVAHRLSTIARADNIVFLDKGIIAEQGTHDDLVALKGKYFSLVKDQLNK